jgi:putative heme transporter
VSDIAMSARWSATCVTLGWADEHREGGDVSEPEQKPISHVVVPEAKGETPSRSSMFRKVLVGMLTGALFALIFIKIIPELASYQDIWEEVRAAPTWQIVGLFGIAVVLLCLSTAMMVLPIRGIGAIRAFITQQGSTAISFTIPGPSGTGMRFLMLRSYGVDVEDFSRGMVAVSIWNNVCMLSMPGVAVLLLVLFGKGGDDSTTLAGWAILAVVVSVALILGVIALLRSVGFARWLGRVSERLTNVFLRLIHKPEVSGWEPACVTLRANTVTVLKARGIRLTVLTLSNYWLNGILLILCLRLVGIDSETLPWGLALATYTVGRLSTVIQVTPGGVGVVEVAYTAAFVAVTSSSLQTTITAGVLIYRGFTYLLPIVVGGFCYLAWRFDKGRGVPVTHGPLDEPLTAT